MKVVFKKNQGKPSKNTKNEIITKYATVRKYQVTRGKRNSKIPKWKRFIAEKILGLTVKDTYYYEVVVDYYNARIVPKDVLVDESGIIYYCISESNRVAKLVTYNAWEDKPVLKGNLMIQRQANNQKQKNGK